MLSAVFYLSDVEYEIPEPPDNSSANKPTSEDDSTIDSKPTTISSTGHTQTNPRPMPRPRTTSVTPSANTSVSSAQTIFGAPASDVKARMDNTSPSHTSG